MHVSFLEAADGRRLTKQFTLDEAGQVHKHSYPNVREFTSHTYDVPDLHALFPLMQQHFAEGHCLIKGKLHKELRAESRASSTLSSDPTQWMLLDIDGAEGFTDAEDFIHTALPAEFHEATYILQHSCSAGIVDQTGLNAHLLFQLHQAQPATVLKMLLENWNYSNTQLRDQLELTASGVTLRYKLDVTTCQNDKLIYGAAPLLGDGLTDTLGSARTQLVVKQHEMVRLAIPTLNPAALKATKDTQVTKLRKTAGLTSKSVKSRMENGLQIITNPDEAVVTGEKTTRGFTYLNLNGGDSWAYYYPEGNPTLLSSFKEPGVAYVLKDICPSYAAALETQQPAEITADQDRPQPLVFRDWATDTYWNGLYYPGADRHEIYPASSKDKMKDFCQQHGARLPKPIPDWALVFDPTNDAILDFENRVLNRFVKTEYLRNPDKRATQLPPTCARVLTHVLGGNPVTIDHFLNWLAFIFQTRSMTGTAWIITGAEGTGKGILFNNILKPLFGETYCLQRTIQGIEDQFNGWLESTIILNVNESRISDSAKASRTVNELKNMITEPTARIRRMRTNQTDARMYINLIFTSNNHDAMKISDTDRRFNVSERQEEKFLVTQEEIDRIEHELPLLAGFLANYTVDAVRARTALMNDAKQTMRQATESSVDQFFLAVQQGDLEYFAQYITTRPRVQDALTYTNFEQVIRSWIASVGTEARVTRDDLRAVYTYIQADHSQSGNKFTRMCKHHGIPISRMRIDGELAYGLSVRWIAEPDLIEDLTRDNVIPLHKAN